MEIDICNKFIVALHSTGVVIMRPPINKGLSKEDCLNLAAYLVSLSMADEDEFLKVLHAVQNT